MGCGCDIATLERYFGYQLQNSGTVERIAQVAAENTDPVYYPTNPYPWKAETGFMGYRYGLDAALVVPTFQPDNYMGIFPTKEQPRIQSPYPYQMPGVL
jgi:hypothetical protein